MCVPNYTRRTGGVPSQWEGTGTGRAPVPFGYPEEAVLVVSFFTEGGSARIVSFE